MSPNDQATYMDKAYMASTPMIGQSVEYKEISIRLKDDDEEVFGAGIPHLSTIGALLYFRKKGGTACHAIYKEEEEKSCKTSTNLYKLTTASHANV
ncbi:hypothetical protein OSB04_018866, partial [Centaurea solstitialis]